MPSYSLRRSDFAMYRDRSAFALRDFFAVRLIKLAAGIDKKCDGRHIADR
jgi:hypothetical protein